MKIVLSFLGMKKFESDIYTLRSLSHEMYLQLVKKSTISQLDDKRCFINDNDSSQKASLLILLVLKFLKALTKI